MTFTSAWAAAQPLPNADAFFDSMVSFPFQHWLSEEDFQYMLAATREVVQSLR